MINLFYSFNYSKAIRKYTITNKDTYINLHISITLAAFFSNVKNMSKTH